MGDTFITVPDEQVPVAEAVASLYRSRSFRVSVEEFDISRPGLPTMTMRRRGETHFILVRRKADTRELGSWVAYCQSRQQDSRVVVVMATEKSASALRAMGVGVIVYQDGGLTELIEARDLAFRSRMPDRSFLKPKARRLLAEPYEKFERGDWYEAFGSACTVLEEVCRSYLIEQRALGRLSYTDGGKLKSPTETGIRKMTLGQLKQVFCNMVRQNPKEANLCRALTLLNPPRIVKAHTTNKAKLRGKVGLHMWTIVNALQELTR